MRLVLKSKRKGKFFFKLVLLSFVLYIVFLIISQSVDIQRKKSKVTSLNQQLSLQKDENEKLLKQIESGEVS